MNNNAIAAELTRVAHLLTGWVNPDGSASKGEIVQQYNRIKNIPDLGQRATMVNLVSEIAMRGQDRAGLSRKPGFRGWGRDDFIQLKKLVARAAASGWRT